MEALVVQIVVNADEKFVQPKFKNLHKKTNLFIIELDDNPKLSTDTHIALDKRNVAKKLYANYLRVYEIEATVSVERFMQLVRHFMKRVEAQQGNACILVKEWGKSGIYELVNGKLVKVKL